MKAAAQVTYFALRVVTGLLFFMAGTPKMFGWFGGVPDMPDGPPLLSQVGIAGVLEVFGGILIMLGLFTRPVAFILSGEMAVAYFQFHQPNGTWPIQNQGVSAVLYCFMFLYMAAQGAGALSIDALLRRKKRR